MGFGRVARAALLVILKGNYLQPGSIRYTKEHLFEADDPLIVNPVNTMGAMGAGLALRFREAYPDLYRVYKLYCKRQQLRIGTGLLYVADRAIFNLPTKKFWRKPSTCEYIWESLLALNKLCDPPYNKIGMTKIGCGLGGLNWETDVKPLIEETLVRKGVLVTIYEGVVPKQEPIVWRGPIISVLIDKDTTPTEKDVTLVRRPKNQEFGRPLYRIK